MKIEEYFKIMTLQIFIVKVLFQPRKVIAHKKLISNANLVIEHNSY